MLSALSPLPALWIMTRSLRFGLYVRTKVIMGKSSARECSGKCEARVSISLPFPIEEDKQAEHKSV